MAKSGSYQMKKPCDCCKRYLDHLDERNQNMTCFLKLMTGNFKHNTIVPNRFLRHFTRELQGTIKLQSPNGCLYDVQVMHCGNKMVLGNGWASFLAVHDIKQNDSLLFRHIDKESCFEVLIFDSDGCEKIFPCAGINKFPSVRQRSVDPFNITSSSEHDTTESSGSGRSTGLEKDSHPPDGKAVRMAITSSSSEESGKRTSSESESFESDGREMLAGANYVISSRSCLSKAQEERVIAFIQKFQPEVTVFVAIMRKSHVQPPAPYLVITREYAVAHFPLEKNTVTLQRPDSSKKWHSKLYKRKDKNVYMLVRKWPDFVHDNNVQVGDIVLLYPTLSGARKSTFTVHILQETATYSRSRRRRGGTGSRTVGAPNNAEMDPEVQIKEKPADGKHASSENSVDELSGKSMESENSGCPQQPLYILPFKSHLSRSQKGIVEEKVRAIQSEIPIYVAILRESMVVGSQRFIMVELGSRYATAVHLPSRGQTVVLQHKRKIWRTKMVVKCGRRFLRGGWPQFVRDSGLRVGDICLFELKKSERKLTMAVHVISREEF